MILKNIKEIMIEIVIDSNWYFIYSNYKWRTGTNIFKSSSYDFIEKSKIDIWNDGESKMFKTLKKKQDYKWIIDNC